jgi:hypothetical protein
MGEALPRKILIPNIRGRTGGPPENVQMVRILSASALEIKRDTKG